MKYSITNKKGVSPIIATLLLIVIAVAAAVVTYAFVIGFIGGSTGGTGTQGQLSYDSYNVGGVLNDMNITAYIRNTGGKALSVQNVYVDGALFVNNATANNTAQILSGTFGFFNSTGGTPTLQINVGEVRLLYIKMGTGDPAVSHTVKIVCADGTAVEFSVRKTT